MQCIIHLQAGRSESAVAHFLFLYSGVRRVQITPRHRLIWSGNLDSFLIQSGYPRSPKYRFQQYRHSAFVPTAQVHTVFMPMVLQRIIVSGTLMPNLFSAGTNGHMPCLPPISDLPNDSFIDTAMYAGKTLHQWLVWPGGQVTVTVQAFCEYAVRLPNSFTRLALQSNSLVWEKHPSHGDMTEAHSSPPT